MRRVEVDCLSVLVSLALVPGALFKSLIVIAEEEQPGDGFQGALEFAGRWPEPGRNGFLRPDRHDHADSLDDAMLADRAGRRALAVSLAGLLVTAAVQAVIVAASGSIGLLADTIHNFADALTAVPIGLAFLVARRPATRRYTYGYGRAEDLAGLAVVAVMTASAAVAAWQATERLVHPRAVHELIWVAAAGVAGNELAARYPHPGRVAYRLCPTGR